MNYFTINSSRHLLKTFLFRTPQLLKNESRTFIKSDKPINGAKPKTFKEECFQQKCRWKSGDYINKKFVAFSVISGCLIGYGAFKYVRHIYESSEKSGKLLENAVSHKFSQTSQSTSKCPFRSLFSLSPVLANCNPAVVCVRLHNGNSLASEQTGFFVDHTGLTLTTGVPPSLFNKISIKTLDGRTFPATIVEYETSSGLCLLQIQTKNPIYFHCLSLLSKYDKATQIGDFLISLGTENSNGFEKFSLGILKSRQHDELGQNPTYLIQMAIQESFTSGGPIVNLQGQVVGVNKTNMNVNEKCQLSIPIECGRELIDRIRLNNRFSNTVTNPSMNTTEKYKYKDSIFR